MAILRTLSALLAPLLMLASPVALSANAPAVPDAASLIAQREEALAYSAGLQAYIFGYPPVDLARVMREETTPGADPEGVYAPPNHLFFQPSVLGPGSLFAGRAPNSTTIYFTAWLDLREGPVLFDAPDTHDRYYSLSFSDLYGEVQHTGRRTTGTAAQTVMVAGPGWQGTAPPGVHVIRLRTELGYFLGRLLLDGERDVKAATALMHRFALRDTVAQRKPLPPLPGNDALASIGFYTELNRFLRANRALPEEAGLMGIFDRAGFGPNVTFDPSALSPATRRGLERAAQDGHAILANGRYSRVVGPGWGPMALPVGRFGLDYFRRAAVEYEGLIGNLPEESIYPSAHRDSAGGWLTGEKRYRLVFPANDMPPADAFWALIAYDVRTLDFIPNRIKRYTLSDRTTGLVKRADGAVEVRIQKDDPKLKGVNWLPVGDGRFMLVMRLYQPRQNALDGTYRLPAIEPLD